MGAWPAAARNAHRPQEYAADSGRLFPDDPAYGVSHVEAPRIPNSAALLAALAALEHEFRTILSKTTPPTG
jgi:hypothetical protein